MKCRPAHYARALLGVLEMKRGLRPIFGSLGVRPVEVTSRRLEDIMKRADRFHRRTPRWCWAVVLGSAALVLPGKGLLLGAAADDSDNSRPTVVKLEEVIAGVERMYGGVQSMKVRYHRETDPPHEPWPRNWVVFAFKGDKRYLDHTRPEVDGELFRSIAVYDGKATREIFGSAASFTNPGRVAPVEWDLYTVRLFLPVVNPPGMKRNPDTTEYWLPYALRRPAWKLLPNQERVGGAWCHVLQLHGAEWGYQKLWIDTDAGFAVRKREFYADQAGQQLKRRSTASKFVQVDQGIWLPKRLLHEWFDPDSPENQAESKEEIRVLEISVNNVPDVLFDRRALDDVPRPVPLPDTVETAADPEAARQPAESGGDPA